MLTKDAKTVLYELYKEYIVRRHNHISKSNAKDFISSDSIQENFFPDCSIDDIVDALRELGQNGFLYNVYSGDTIYHCELTDYTISVMENQKKETFLTAVDFISKFIP